MCQGKVESPLLGYIWPLRTRVPSPRIKMNVSYPLLPTPKPKAFTNKIHSSRL